MTEKSGLARRQFLWFSAAGACGFVVDATTLLIVMSQLGAGLYSGRILSYLVAASCTWALNRRYTFRQQRSNGQLGEWTRFVFANAFGGIVNYATYATLVTLNDTAAAYPVIGVAAGSVAGLAVNFTASRHLVFTGDKSPT